MKRGIWLAAVTLAIALLGVLVACGGGGGGY
jgi:hypothetical protein